MKAGSLPRCCTQRTVLVVTHPADEASQVLVALRNATGACARIVLAQLNAQPSRAGESNGLARWSFEVPRTHRRAAGSLENDPAWDSILRQVFFLGGVSAEDLPRIVRALQADRVVTPSPTTAEHIWRVLRGEAVKPEVPVPMWVTNRHLAPDFMAHRTIRRILVPLSMRRDFEVHLHLACRFARAYDATVSILHVFSGAAGVNARERTPQLVNAQLPLRSLRLSGLLCPMEVTVRSGNVADAILHFQRTGSHDLIVLRRPQGSLRGWSSHFNVHHRLVSEAHCPVIVVGDAPLESVRDAVQQHDSLFDSQTVNDYELRKSQMPAECRASF